MIRVAFKHLQIIVGSFFAMIGLLGAFHLEDWLANWARHFVVAFREVSHFLFQWVRVSEQYKEMIFLSTILTTIYARGVIIEHADVWRGPHVFLGKDQYLQNPSIERTTLYQKYRVIALILLIILSMAGVCFMFLYSIYAVNSKEYADNISGFSVEKRYLALAAALVAIIVMFSSLCYMMLLFAPISTSYTFIWLVLLLIWGRLSNENVWTFLPNP